ncbi:MAG TPA: tRNA lysidine(34) synthetase TilS [Methylomirabilota bacterium]|nr:tRNA lysidine(34) synthetase TilS [Methylomirabilota bacterium]
MPASVLDLVRDTVRRHAMLASGDTVLVALSGGADSTALLLLLSRLAPELGLILHALHVDHGLRPDSVRDAQAALALGERLGVPVEVVAVTVDRDGSLEEAARRARYAALEAHADRIGATRIAVAHTADDQAETVLMRLLESAGVRGLAGIPPVRGRVVRPVLALRRRQLVAELEGAGLGWVEDPTNRNREFFRNRIRHDVLPLIAAAHDADVVPALARVAARAREAVDALERLAARELARVATVGADDVLLPRETLAALPRPAAVEVLRQAAARLGSRAPLRAWAHRGLARVLAEPAPRHPFRLGAVTIEASSRLVRVARRGDPPTLTPRALAVPGSVELPEARVVIEARLCDPVGYAVPRAPARAAFDADALALPLTVRGRRQGDRFRPWGGPGERRLKSFMIDVHIPRWERDRLVVVESAGEIAWLAGVRRAALAPITDRTRGVIELSVGPLA